MVTSYPKNQKNKYLIDITPKKVPIPPAKKSVHEASRLNIGCINSIAPPKTIIPAKTHSMEFDKANEIVNVRQKYAIKW